MFVQRSLRTATAALAATLALGGAASAAPEDAVAPLYADVGDWNVYTNPLMGDGCFAAAQFDGGTEIRMGIDETTNRGFVAAFNDAWTPAIDNGTVTAIDIVIGETVYATEATEVEAFGREGYVTFLDSQAALSDIPTRGTVEIYADDAPVTAVMLEQAADALATVQECQTR